MKTYNYLYDDGNLADIIDFSLFKKEPNVLVQVFCGKESKVLKSVVEMVLERIPHAICIGTTTDGEICEKNVTTFKTSISISVFWFTTLKTAYVQEDNAFESGLLLASKLVTPNTKLLILFSDGTYINAENFLKGIESFNPSIPICGGMAGDNGKLKQTFIASQHTMIDKGIVGVSLNSDVLQVATDYKFDWKAIGVEQTIDEVEDNRIYKIDGMKPVKFYEKYLGNPIAQIEFPLIVERNGIPMARAVIAKHADGSLSCAGNLLKSDKVKIGLWRCQITFKRPH